MRYKVFSRCGMVWPPKRGDQFRVGKHIGTCIFTCRWFVIMRLWK